jgi:hypothetical protein
MKEYRVVWQRMPYAYNPAAVLFIEAAGEDDAKDVAERRFGVPRQDFSVRDVREAASPPSGRVKEAP